ncbi:MAG: laccase domain-containing protein, partial [Desulfomonile tiedjei]|nr:laccase domain-containing protein [Desulfomonile tiedjei]
MPASNNSTYLTVPELFENNTVLAFSTRKGGCSEPPLSSLNFSTSQGDSQENVRENFRILTRALGVTPQGIVTCRQVHSDNVEVLSSVPPAPPVADALMTTKAGVFLGIKTADCLPVLLLDSNRGVAAAVHAGWRGTVLRLTRKVVRLMKTEFGS